MRGRREERYCISGREHRSIGHPTLWLEESRPFEIHIDQRKVFLATADRTELRHYGVDAPTAGRGGAATLLSPLLA